MKIESTRRLENNRNLVGTNGTENNEPERNKNKHNKNKKQVVPIKNG